MIRKIMKAIRFWFCHTTTCWMKFEDKFVVMNLAIFDKILSAEEMTFLRTVVDDKSWHHIVIMFRRFGKQEFYMDGKPIKELAGIV